MPRSMLNIDRVDRVAGVARVRCGGVRVSDAFDRSKDLASMNAELLSSVGLLQNFLNVILCADARQRDIEMKRPNATFTSSLMYFQ